MGGDLISRNSESRSSPDCIPQTFWCRFSLITVAFLVPGQTQVLSGVVLSRRFPGFDMEIFLFQDSIYLVLKSWQQFPGVCAHSSVIHISIFDKCLADVSCSSGGESGRYVRTVAAFFACRVVTRCTVPEGNYFVPVENPRRFGGWRGREWWLRNTNNS